MVKIYPKSYFEDKIIAQGEANLNIASSAVLYGLSVYTVFPLTKNAGHHYAFRLKEHFERLLLSAQIIGLDTFAENWTWEKFVAAVKEVTLANDPEGLTLARVTVHANEILPGTRSRGLKTTLSIFLYESDPILPASGARLKTSVWRRVPDYAIPSRAKVNGAYVNSVLAKQDALDSGYDDCLFLDVNGHVCELSAANIFIVRQNVLITPDTSSDLLEGITRRTVLELAEEHGLKIVARPVDLTELYIADEIFACGTSALISPVLEVDKRIINHGQIGEITKKLSQSYQAVLSGTGKYNLQID